MWLAAKLLLPKTALNGPVPCVPSPLAQACGGEDILHTFFQYFLDIPSPGPHHKSLLGALLLAAPCFTIRRICTLLHYQKDIDKVREETMLVL